MDSLDKDIKELEKQFLQEFQANKKLQTYLSQYDPESTESFLNGYAKRKAIWYKYADLHIRHNEGEDLQWVEAGFAHLERIQQKKLFNVQCKWRAEKVVLPEVEICADFKYWQHNIFRCPFIDPISEEEVETYIAFLRQANLKDDAAVEFWDDWQSYDELKAAANPDGQNYFSNYPEWYEFYDIRFGTAGLINLPDVRGEKERKYLAAGSKLLQIRAAKQRAKEPQEPKKPGLYKSAYNTEFLEWFIHTFENAQTKKYYEADKRYSRVNQESDEIMEDIKLLLKSGETLPIEAHSDWTEALRQTANRYKTGKIIEFLPHTYEQYKLKREMNLFPHDDFIDSMRDSIVKLILDGREALGEPRNLDF